MGRDECEIRQDPEGDGHFGASRGTRTHRGVDFVCQHGDTIISPVHGQVTKIGYPYASGPGGANGSSADAYRYIQITTNPDEQSKRHHRLFYLTPGPPLQIGVWVKPDTRIASAMDVARRYDTEDGKSQMLTHIHYEIKTATGEYLNPMEEMDWRIQT